MDRCKKCILPATYPGIAFDDRGVCHFCNDYKPLALKGAERLRQDILSWGRNFPESSYDCAVGFSGGRDSTYLLYYLSRVLGLKVLAFTVDNGNIPSDTESNISDIASRMAVNLVRKKFDYLDRCFPTHLRAFLNKPTAAMITALCVGCRLGLAKGVYQLMMDYKVPVYVHGNTSFEGNGYKTNLLRKNLNDKRKCSLVAGYVQQVMANPFWMRNLYAFFIQCVEFKAYFGRFYFKKLSKKGMKVIAPFNQYIKWEEKEIVDTLQSQLNWKAHRQMRSNWRGDCHIAILKSYLYNALLGFNDIDDAMSDLIRDGQISRNQALRRMKEEKQIPEKVIRSIVGSHGIDFNHFKQSVLSPADPMPAPG